MPFGPRSSSRCLVTGLSGYIGGRLGRTLTEHGWTVHALGRRCPDNWPTDRFHVFDGSFASVARAVRAAAPDIIFHLASAVTVDHKSEDVAPVIAANVTFPALLMQAMVSEGYSHLVCTGTHWQHFDGSADYHPANFYAATKQAAQDLAKFYVEASAINVLHLKLFDVYGPDDPRPKLIPYLIRGALTGERLELSPGHQEIDLVHVDDVVSAYLAAAEWMRQSSRGLEVFGVRTGRVLTIRGLVQVIEGVLNKPLDVAWGMRPYRAREVMRTATAIDTLPAWRPSINLEEGLISLVPNAVA